MKFFTQNKVLREVFHNFGPDLPPPKVVKPQFFLHHDQKTIMCKTKKISLENPKKLFKKINI